MQTAHPRAVDQASMLLRVARLHLGRLHGQWRGQVTTTDGTYLVVLWASGVTLLLQASTHHVLRGSI
jgi:hypothetical protein